jgi:hypothetical protein
MNKETILVHLPSYRDPELIPTIKDALKQAKYPKRIHFGICRQFNPDDKFDNVDEFRKDRRFKIMDVPFKEAKGLPWARAQINDHLLTDEDFVLQLDSHHRFAKDWDVTLISMHKQMEDKGFKPIIAGYLPLYNPFDDPAGRADVPWQAQFACFYPHGTIFIRPALLSGWENMTEPAPARFLSGHFSFARSQWARDVKHDPDIYFSGEEINLSVRSYTHGYNIFHPHRLVIWHSTMREERSGMLKWDDDAKYGVDWYNKQEYARKKIRVLFGAQKNNSIDFGEYGLGTERTVEDYEAFAGVNFKTKQVQLYALENQYPPTPKDSPWVYSFYHLVTIHRNELPGEDYSSILIAFDDENGIGIKTRDIRDHELHEFLKNGKPIHYEEFFTYTEKKPARLVAWAVDRNGQWAERVEHKIN